MKLTLSSLDKDLSVQCWYASLQECFASILTCLKVFQWSEFESAHGLMERCQMTQVWEYEGLLGKRKSTIQACTLHETKSLYYTLSHIQIFSRDFVFLL